MPSASAAIDEMWLWNAVRSGITEPTTMPSRSAGRRPGTESKHALPASQIRSRYVAFRTPKRVMPAPTRATRRIPELLSAAASGARPHLTAGRGPAARGRANDPRCRANPRPDRTSGLC